MWTDVLDWNLTHGAGFGDSHSPFGSATQSLSHDLTEPAARVANQVTTMFTSCDCNCKDFSLALVAKCTSSNRS
eukprot:m.112715 g.112715  ORF g.112715 m.112715 type:complete len:74 (+) comp12984_c0_seq1:3008-3229(+)